MVTREAFEATILRAFNRAVKDYADSLEQDLKDDGYVPCPYVQEVEIFEIAVERFIKGMTREEIRIARSCSLEKIDKACRRVSELTRYKPESLPRQTKRRRNPARRRAK